MNRLGAVLIALLCPSAGASDLTSAVPKEFLGTWDASPASCGEQFSDMRLQIKAKDIQFWESSGPLKAIVVKGHTDIALIAELSGEGETWLEPIAFRLSEDKQSLSDLRFDKPVVRHRCKAKP